MNPQCAEVLHPCGDDPDEPCFCPFVGPRRRGGGPVGFPMSDPETFARHHLNCDAPWTCAECGRLVCPRCEVSPAEFVRCAECDWFSGGAA